MVQVQFVSAENQPLGMINWFAVHPTSMNNTNRLVSSDNVGLASIMMEQKMNPDQLIGKVNMKANSVLSYISFHFYSNIIIWADIFCTILSVYNYHFYFFFNNFDFNIQQVMNNLVNWYVFLQPRMNWNILVLNVRETKWFNLYVVFIKIATCCVFIFQLHWVYWEKISTASYKIHTLFLK